MFANITTRRFVSVFALLFIAFLLVGIGFLGYNPYNGSIDVLNGMDDLASAFGGFKSFGAIIGIILAGLVVVGGLFYMTDHHYDNERGAQAFHILLGVVILFVAATVGVKWIHAPSSLGWVMLGFILFTAVISAVTIRLSHK